MKKPIFLNILPILVLLLLAACMASCTADDSQDDGQQEMVFDSLHDEVQYIIESHFTFGAVAVKVINGADEFSIFHGARSRSNNNPPDENTLYLSGSITKTFTATVLAQMVIEGSIGLEDEVQAHLPGDRVTMPTFNGIPVKLIHLATHTSGLEQNLADEYPLPEGTTEEDPFAGMTEENIYDYLSNYAVLHTEPGTVYEYSNFGFGLLGLVLGKVKNETFKNLLKAVVLDELGMTRSSYNLTDESMNNIAPGHSEYLTEVEPWSNDHDLVGCGGLNTTLKDMTAYLKANMGVIPTGLRQAMDLCHQAHFGTDQGLGWYKSMLSDGQTITGHGGGSAGHRTFIGFNREFGTGVVLLYNVAPDSRVVRDVAMRILEIARKY